MALTIALFAAASAAAQHTAAGAASSLPTPESVFGFPVGADYKLFTYDQSIDYFQKLAAASNRIRLITVGKTAYGKTWTAAIISSPANLARLDKIRENNMRLAHPGNLTDAQAHDLARQGRAIVDISGGLHASEIAGSQHTPQVAYELLSRAAEPEMKTILDSVVFFLWPSINPDGQDIVVNWCRANQPDAEHNGRGAVPMELYEKYVGHDNNRDSYMLNVIESRVIQRTWREWEPDVVYVQHQSSPFPTRIWIPPFADPVGFRVPPIMAREVNAIGTRIAEQLDANGMPGAVSQLETYDAWYPGYIDYMPMYQNIPAWWTETQGGNCATPRTSTVADLPADYADLRPTSLYSSPWAEGKWGLRDAVNYMVSADLTTLDYAARFKSELLYNRYQAARNTIQQFKTSAPYAYFISQDQHDPRGAGRAAAARGVHGRSRAPAEQRRFLRRGVVPQGNLGHPDGPGVRAARSRAVRAAEVSRVGFRPDAVRRCRVDASLPDGRQRRRGEIAAHRRHPRRTRAAARDAGRLAHRSQRAAHDQRRGSGHRPGAGRNHWHR